MFGFLWRIIMRVYSALPAVVVLPILLGLLAKKGVDVVTKKK
jgi:hypothetical protein